MDRLESLCREIRDTHHAFLKEELPRIGALLLLRHASCADPEAARLIVRIAEIFRFLSRDITTHMVREEKVLFPAIAAFERASSGARLSRGGPPGGEPAAAGEEPQTLTPSVRRMMFEHEETLSALDAIDEARAGFPRPGEDPLLDGLQAALGLLSANVREHVRVEEETLFLEVLRAENAHYLSSRHPENAESLDKEELK